MTEIQSLVIKGGKPLNGEVEVRGAKNSISKCMVASLLSDQPSILKNVSDIEDVEIVSKMIEAFGGEVEYQNKSKLKINPKNLHQVSLKDVSKFAGRSRIPILFAGPLLHRLGEAQLPTLGGCNIGSRPIDFHLDVLRQTGATVKEEGDFLKIKTQKLVGSKIHLDYPSVGTTEQVILSATLADGVTQLTNAAVEPEIMDLIAVLQKMGAIISVDTDRTINITGVKKLRGFEHSVVTDRIEVASWAAVAAATNGKILVKNARQQDMFTFLNKFRQMGGEFDITEQGITFYRANGELQPLSLETDVFPGFSTDYQQPLVVALTQAKGVSIIHETVYENRFGYVDALIQMGAQIQLHRECLGTVSCRFGQKNHLHSAVIVGPTKLKGTKVVVPDLRGGFSYIVAALSAEGQSTLENILVINRGYENFIEKLKNLGADISTK